MTDAARMNDRLHQSTEVVQTCPGRYPEHGESPDHDWEERVDWEGDPNVINGTRTWKVLVCRVCGEEQ